MITPLQPNNPYIKNDFGSNSAIFGDNQILGFQFDRDSAKIITNISASFRKDVANPTQFRQSAVAVFRGRIESVRLPYRIDQLETAERIEKLQFFETWDGSNLNCYITAGVNEVISVILFPAFFGASGAAPGSAYGTLNVYGSFASEKALFKPVI